MRFLVQLPSLLAVTILSVGCLFSATIEDKIAALQDRPAKESKAGSSPAKASPVLSNLRKELQERYKLVEILIEEKAEENDFFDLLEEINIMRGELQEIEEKWRTAQATEMMGESESHGIWEHEDITLSQLILEYGSQEFLYVIPQEVGSVKLNLHSAFMIPRESWADLLETVLKSNGVGIRQVNPYTKQLYLLKGDLLAVSVIAARKVELEALDDKTRVAFIFSPNAENLRSAFYFLERFRDPKTTFIYQVGQKIAIVGFKNEVKRLVSLCENVWNDEEEKITKVVTTPKIQPEEIVKILKSYFGGLSDPRGSMMGVKGGHDLSVFPLASEGGVILIGSRSVVDRAERIITETQSQVDDPFELTVFWYTCSHSDPVNLAEILEQVYSSLINTGMVGGDVGSSGGEGFSDMMLPVDGDAVMPQPPPRYITNDVNSSQNGASGKRKDKQEKSAEKSKSFNFIPYPATGSILMVVRKDTLDKLKEVIKRLDIAKRMVEIEVLLVERRVVNQSKSGINLLKIGGNASNTKKMYGSFDETDQSPLKGLFEFVYSIPQAGDYPALDMAWGFLLSQEDIRITASPSVLMTNQTTSVISITDQISIVNGSTPVQSGQGTITKDTFERAEFGITITLTPTVHEPELDDPTQQIYVTLENDIVFESIKGDRKEGKPDIHKRHIQNQVRIPDGETVILGGLKSKAAEDKSDKIPFLGEIAGIGKLFGSSAQNDSTNEMFIFIRPKVTKDLKRDLQESRDERLKKRAGDMSLLLEKIKSARELEKANQFSKSIKLFYDEGTDESLDI